MRTACGMTIAVFVLFFSAACGGARDAGTGAAGSKPAPSAAASLQSNAEAKELFATWCSGCHGERGRGDGPAAAALEVKPRNFTRELFKVRSTPSGQPPTRQDVFETISRGLPGSAMPAHRFLEERERWVLADYVRRIAGIAGGPEPKALALGDAPRAGDESARRGKEVYAKLGCAKCHGNEGRGDGPSSNDLKDTQGRPIPARDYTRGEYLGGDSAEAIHMRFASGMDGTPMPSFIDAMSRDEGWALTHYVLSLRRPKPAPPADPIAYGRAVVQEKQCFACHVIEGRGGDVGPSLDVAAAKLRYDWVRAFLKEPHKQGKIYHYVKYRMPDLGLQPAEIDAVVALFAKIAGRPTSEPAQAAANADPGKVAHGQLLYFLKCTECHNMGRVIPTPGPKQQGPDLIQVSRRVRYEWIPTWVNNPKQVYPAARMVDTNLTEEETEAVRAFIWKTSVEAQGPTQ